MFPRCLPFFAVLVPFIFASTEIADAQVAADVNPANASNNPLTPKLTFYLQNFYMPSVAEESNRDSDEVLLRLYVPYTLYGIQNSLRIYAPIETVPVAPGKSGAGGGPSVQAFGVEPLIFYNLPNGFYLCSSAIWSLGFGTEPSYIPIGLGIGKVFKLPGGATLNLHVEPQYSVYTRGTGAPRWQLLTGMIVQF